VYEVPLSFVDTERAAEAKLDLQRKIDICYHVFVNMKPNTIKGDSISQMWTSAGSSQWYTVYDTVWTYMYQLHTRPGSSYAWINSSLFV